MPELSPGPTGTGRAPARPLKHRILRWTGITAAALSGLILLGAIALLVTIKFMLTDMSNVGDLYALNRPAALTFLDQNDKAAGVRGAILGDRLTLSQMPPYLPKAFIAAEDRKFYEHGGI